MFREAYNAEAERYSLLRQQLETALAEKLSSEGGDSGVRIAVESLPPLSPEEAGGQSTWRSAFEAVKLKTADLDQQLLKAKAIGSAAAAAAAAATASAPPASSSSAAGATAAEAKPLADGGDARAGSGDPPSSKGADEGESSSGGGPFGFFDPEKNPQDFNKLEQLAQNTIEDENTLRLIAVPILGRGGRGQVNVTSLPPLGQVREVMGRSQFNILEIADFERVYIFRCSTARSVASGDALASLQRELDGQDVEVFVQKAKQENQNLVLVMLKEDLPKNEFVWWQWLIVVVLFFATLLSVNVTTLGVTTLTDQQMSAMTMDQAIQIASKTVPTAICTFATVAAQEVARRTAASKYGVDLTPPFFVPVWPIPSLGTLGAVTRRLSLVPNEEASLAMSAAAGLTGFAVSLLVIAAGLSMGPDPDKILNLNFQLLPLVLKLVLKPLLGQTSLTDLPDPFADPVSLAFPSNPVTIGGVAGLMITSLNLLPIGRLDGGIIAKGIFGNRTGGLISIAAFFLLLFGALSPGQASTLYVTYLTFTAFFQNGSELPVKDSVSEVDDSAKAIAGSLVILGVLLSLPGALLPNF